jgi:hypothetical protein
MKNRDNSIKIVLFRFLPQSLGDILLRKLHKMCFPNSVELITVYEVRDIGEIRPNILLFKPKYVMAEHIREINSVKKQYPEVEAYMECFGEIVKYRKVSSFN